MARTAVSAALPACSVRDVELGLVARSSTNREAGIVHDLGNLIQVMSSALNIISREVTGGSAQRLSPVIATARSSLDRASALVRDSLLTARGETPLTEPVDLGDSLRNLVPAMQAMSGPAIDLSLRLDGQAFTVLCNRVELERAVLNLVLNARDAMPDGGRASITICRRHGETVLRVADTGCGMTAEVKARILEPFFTTRSASGGNGIGLATVASFVAAANGRIEIESLPGLGSVFSLMFRDAVAGKPAS